jgi:WD40 repeat protein
MKEPLTDQPHHCVKCGAVVSVYALEGLCGRCLLKPGLQAIQNTLEEVADESHVPAGESKSRRLTNTNQLGRFGDYELLEEIARGGMGIVYRARQVSLDRIVAVKMLLAGPLAGKDFVQRFRTEAAAAASLQHPGIVAIHEVGFAEGQHFFAMDYVKGLTLAQRVAKGPLPAGQAAAYLKGIAEAIHFAHEQNVLHRDLKPSNVLIDSATDQPRITDFGLAKRLEAETELTLTGQLLGSPNYVSPEQALARRGTVGKHSDVYSLGAILYHLLTGRPPFQGETLSEVLRQLAADDPLAPRLLIPGVPQDLETICLKCLEKEPASRYQTAQELADELQRFLRHEPIVARPITSLEHAWRWCQRKPAVAALGAATLLLLLAVAIGSPIAAFRLGRERDRANQTLYDSDMSLAQHTWDDGDLGGTLSVLESHRPKAGEKEDRRGFEWYYYRNLCQGDPHIVMVGHSNAVNCVVFSRDGKSVASGSPGSAVQIWDSANGSLLRSLPEPNVVSLAFAPDGRILGVGGQDQVSVWNLETRECIFKRAEALGQFRVAFLPMGTLMMVGKHAGHNRFGSDGGSAELWDYAAGQLKYVFPESGGFIALSPDGDRLATGNWNRTIKIWDLATLQLIKTLNIGEVISMAWSPKGHTLITADRYSEVGLWDITSGRKVRSLTNNQHVVWALAVSPDGRCLATASEDQTIHLWDMATFRQNEQLTGHRAEASSVDFSPDSQRVVSGSKDRSAMLWSIHPHRPLTTVSNISSPPIFSTDGRWIAAGTNGAVVLWDVATLQVQAVLPGARDAVAFLRDRVSLVTRSTNEFLRTFDLNTFAARETVSNGPVAEINDYAALSPDERTLAVGQANGTLTFFDARTGVVLSARSHAYASNIFQIAFSPNGKFLATAGREVEAGRRPAAKVFDARTHAMIVVLAGHTDTVLGLGFSADGKLLATCGVDDTIRFWNTATWKEIPPALGQKEIVNSLCFSPDGRTLASSSLAGAMKFLDLTTRHELVSHKPCLTVHYINFSPDGQTLAAYGWDHLLRLWRAPVPDKSSLLPGG